MKFIKLTECSSKEKEIFINVNMIQAIYKDGTKTRLYHPSHNNGGWTIAESPEQILELIKQLN